MCYDNDGNWVECYSPEFCTAEPPIAGQHAKEPTPAKDAYRSIAKQLEGFQGPTDGVGFPD